MDRISKDDKFLKDTLGGEHGVISKDGYTKKLLELYDDIYVNDDGDKPNFANTADSLGVHRSDYMLDGDCDQDGPFNGYGLKQVELNTIASSFAGLAANVAGMHRMLTERFGDELKVRIFAICIYCRIVCHL